ncbi:MAG: MFS transporter [Thermaceae bacterium]|nr:MFS transporter [Thermaceae bacterium]
MRLRLTSGSALALLMSGIIGAAPGAVIPQWQHDFSVSREVAWYFNLFFVGGLLGTFLGSRMRLRHPWFPLALVSEGLGLLLVAFTPLFGGILLAAPLLGLGLSVCNFHGNTLPGELYAKGRLVVLNRINAVFGVGAVLAPLLLTLLPWRVGYILFAGVALITAALLWKAPPPVLGAHSKAKGQVRLLPLILITFVAYVALEVVLATFSGIYLRHLGYDARLIGVLLSVHWVVFSIGRVTLSGFIAQRTINKLGILATLATLAVGVYFVPPLAVLFPLTGFLISPIFPTLYGFTQIRVGYFALAYVFYFASAGANLIPGAFALLPAAAIPLGILSIAGILVLLIQILGKQSQVAQHTPEAVLK